MISILQIKETLKFSPGLTAKALARKLSQSVGASIEKRDINPFLYGTPGTFRFEGYTPPRWFLNDRRPIQIKPENNIDLSNLPEQPVNATPKSTPDGLTRRIRDYNPTPIPLQAAQPAKLNKELYGWQEDAVNAWKLSEGRGVIEAVTGTGKTLCALYIVNKYVAAGKRVLILVPSVVLLGQWKRALKLELNTDVTSLLGGGNRQKLDLSSPITLGVINSVSRVAEELEGYFHLIIADECHRYAAPSYKNALLITSPHRLGLTATLERSDEGIEEILLPYFESTCFEYGYADAKIDGVIARYSVAAIGVDLSDDEMDRYVEAGKQAGKARYFLIKNYRYPANPFGKFMEKVAKASGQFDPEGKAANRFLAALRDRKIIISETPSKIKLVPDLAHAIGVATRTLIFCETIQAAEDICETLLIEGIDVAAYHSNLRATEREDILDDLSSGEIECIVAVHALDEGVDVPDIDFGIILAGTKQRRQMIQRMGRIVRKKDDGRNAFFAIFYAKGTTEDPNMEDPDDGHLSIIRDHADNFFSISADEFDGYDFSELVEKHIFDKPKEVSDEYYGVDDIDEDIPF